MQYFQLLKKYYAGFRSFRHSYSHDTLLKVMLVSCIIVFISLTLFAKSSSDSTKNWVGTWSCAPYAVASGNTPPAIANNTLRQVVRVSIGGDTLRVKFSNRTCATAVTMNSVNIAVSPDGTKSAITASTMKQLKFNGNATVTMNAGTTVTSDPIAFTLTPSMRVAITIYYGSAGNGVDMTGHVGSRTDSYLLTGDQTANAAYTGATTVSHWYHINTIDVKADTTKTHAIACFGNSITDGYGLSGGLQNRWPDMFSQALLKNSATAYVGVLNLGIGGTNVAGTGATTGATRYQQDILDQSGVRWIIIFYGINDICSSGTSADTITAAYKKMITTAHAKNMKVYGATITPVNGNTYYSAAHEAVRSTVNKWIRTTGNFDAYIDFDKTIRNPDDTTRLQATYENDWLHPNAAGYKLLGESIDPDLFTQTVKITEAADKKRYSVGEIYSNHFSDHTTITFEIPHEAFVSLKVYSILGKEIAELAGKNFSSGKHRAEFNTKNLAKGMYLYSIKIDNISGVRKIIFPVY
jgi:lysophospholipase L1-like esterase